MNTFEVYSFLPIDFNGETRLGEYEYRKIYGGESFADALFTLFREKSKGINCVKLEWRGEGAPKEQQ